MPFRPDFLPRMPAPARWVRGALCALGIAGAGVCAADLTAPPDLRQLPASAPSRAAAAASSPAAAASRAVAQAASATQAVVIEDRFTRIEELHERGEVRSIKVQPKGGRAYEIVPATGGRDMSNSAGNGRAAAGQRVWPVLSF
ncbi:DUF2782 domain-containing protein [Sphaerotilus microaerophilus]|nr:DUF2782 domain-containing protein [Sphaerotilus sp. FB-5]